VADYWIVRRRTLDVAALYRRGGAYEYRGGFNPAALVALAIGVAPNLPGFLHAAGVLGPASPADELGRTKAVLFPNIAVPSAFDTIYTYAWFVGFTVAGLCYLVLMRRARSPSAARAASRR
jgi:nucleobase:cation symporter-1, NCS1 family